MKFLETKIEFLKLWIVLLVTMSGGSIAWLYNNYDKIEFYKSLIAFVVIVIIIIITALLTKKSYKLIKEIKTKENKND